MPSVVTSEPTPVISAVTSRGGQSLTPVTTQPSVFTVPAGGQAPALASSAGLATTPSTSSTSKSITSSATSRSTDAPPDSSASQTAVSASKTSLQHPASSSTVGHKAETSPPTAIPDSSNKSAHSSGLSSTAKLGIGLGVPFGSLVVGIIAFLTFRYGKHKANSRLRHHGNVAAAGLYPAIDDKAASSRFNDKDTANIYDVEKGTAHDMHELHGQEVPPYSGELVGTPGTERQELSPRRGSV